MKKVLVCSLALVLVLSATSALAEQNEHEIVYDTFITLCGVFGITLNDAVLAKTEADVNVKLSANIADGAEFSTYYDAGKLTGYALSLIGDSYAGENISDLCLLFVVSVDRTLDLTAAESVLANLTATATEDEKLPGITRCSYSTDTYDYSFITMMGEFILSIKPI